MTLGELFAGIANAIRLKDGTTASIPATTFPDRIMAISGGGSGGGDGSPYVVNIPVTISASVSVTAEDYRDTASYTHALYNGVRLPRIPESVLASYPYAFISRVDEHSRYDILFSKGVWYYDGSARLTNNVSDSEPYYKLVDGTDEWVAGPSGNYGTPVATRPVIWSNHDIPNGSATATDIYFEGTDPVLTD